MMIKLTLFILLIIAVAVQNQAYKSGNCPLRNSVGCTNRCASDWECSLNKKCCPNKCGSTSCAMPSVISTGDDGGYKGSYKNDVYCNGQKCSLYEKCEFDRKTKRERCIRT